MDVLWAISALLPASEPPPDAHSPNARSFARTFRAPIAFPVYSSSIGHLVKRPIIAKTEREFQEMDRKMLAKVKNEKATWNGRLASALAIENTKWNFGRVDALPCLLTSDQQRWRRRPRNFYIRHDQSCWLRAFIWTCVIVEDVRSHDETRRSILRKWYSASWVVCAAGLETPTPSAHFLAAASITMQ